jgi:hypothetical protein
MNNLPCELRASTPTLARSLASPKKPLGRHISAMRCNAVGFDAARPTVNAVGRSGGNRMRSDRTAWRICKVAILLGAIGLVGEGTLELGRLAAQFYHPPGVPGQSKIIEHFALQHVFFPAIAVALVFWPPSLNRLFGSIAIRLYLGALIILVTVTELIVSIRSDLFRPYSFALRSALLNQLQTVPVGHLSINLLQAQHLLFSHFVLMGAILMLAINPNLIARFAGPRTGERRFSASTLSPGGASA